MAIILKIASSAYKVSDLCGSTLGSRRIFCNSACVQAVAIQYFALEELTVFERSLTIPGSPKE